VILNINVNNNNNIIPQLPLSWLDAQLTLSFCMEAGSGTIAKFGTLK